MSIRRLLLAVASIGLSVCLVILLVRIGHIDAHETLRLIENVSGIAFCKLLFLDVLLVLISTKKWRSTDAFLRSPADPVPSRITSFAITSAGMALGLVLPVQLGMTTARTLGTYFHGRTLKRGMAGTIFEQGFDVLTISLLAIASGVTRVVRGGGVVWMLLAATMVGFTLLLAAPLVDLIRRFATYAHILQSRHSCQGRVGAVLQSLSAARNSPVLSTSLARRLMMLSTIRFVIVVLMAGQTAAAIGAPIPLWHLAAAVPFVFVATVIAITPGGLGVNELTCTTVLSLFGTPLLVAARWSLANRILGTAACIVVTGCAAITFAIKRYRCVEDVVSSLQRN
jgi:uncharacterized membrane protein YbhN (UPF0104 family)